MKKITTILTTYILAFITVFAFIGCGSHDAISDGGSSNTVNRASEMRAISTKCVVEKSDDCLDVIESFYDNDYNYWIFDMGLLIDVPLDNVFQYYKYSGGNVNYKYSTTETTANSIKRNTQQSSTRATNWSNSDKVSVKGGVNFGKKDVWGVTIELGYDHTWNYGGSESTSWSRSFESCEQKSATEAKCIDIAFDENCPYGYYSYRYVGAIEVFATVIQDRASKEYFITTYTCVKAFGYSLDYDPNSLLFDNYDENKFDFDLSVINTLEEPTQYVNIDGSSVNKPNVVQKQVIYDEIIRTGTTTIYNRNHNVIDTVNFNYPYVKLETNGFTKVNISLTVDIKEYRKSSDLYNGIDIQDKSGNSVRDWQYKRHKGDWETYQIDVNNLDLFKFYMGDNKFKLRVKYYCKNSNFQDWYLGTVRVKVIAFE